MIIISLKIYLQGEIVKKMINNFSKLTFLSFDHCHLLTHGLISLRLILFLGGSTVFFNINFGGYTSVMDKKWWGSNFWGCYFITIRETFKIKIKGNFPKGGYKIWWGKSQVFWGEFTSRGWGFWPGGKIPVNWI